MVRDPAVGRALGKLAWWSARNAKSTIAIISVLTVAVGAGVFQLQTDSDLLKILPKDDPTTIAARNASTEFRGFYDFVYLYYDIDPAKCTDLQSQMPFRLSEANCNDVRDETYVRAMDELWTFIQSEIPFALYSIDLANIVKSINYTNSGFAQDDPMDVLGPLLAGQAPDPTRPLPPRDEAFALPGTDPQGEVMYEGAWRGANAADESIDDLVAPTLQAGRTLIFFDTSENDLSRVELGTAVYAMVDAYHAEVLVCDETPAACTLRWNAFTSEPMSVRGVSALDAHASQVTQRDINFLAPWIVFAIVFVLYAAFRDARVLLVSAANLFVAFIWTAGLMGWLQIPFSALNLTIIPLILGVGIDYGIHTISEFLEHKSEGLSNHEAFHEAGQRAGIAMGIATITTVAGLLLMVLSPSILMGQLGIVASLALIDTFLLTLTLIPAVLTLTARRSIGQRHEGSRWFLAMSRAIGRHRIATIAVVAILSVGAFASAQRLEPEPFGNPELNYPPGDRVRDDSQHISDVFFGGNADTQSNFLVVEGDLTEPDAHRFLDTLEVEMEEHPDIQGFSVTSLTRVVRAWKAIEDGTADALVNQFILSQSGEPALADVEYPQTQAEIQSTFDAIFASPFANFMTILLQEDGYRLGTLTYDTNQELTYTEVEKVWDATWQAIYAAQAEVYGADQRDDAYTGPMVHPFGNNAFSHLFIEEQLPWVNYVAALAFFLVVAMIALLTRNLRATACTAVVMGATSLWWLGSLPLMGAGLSVGLMLPLVFIMAIGSDDAIHLIWNIHRTQDPARVYRFVGKAVTLTTVTTIVAFLIFSVQTDLLVRRTLLATAAAVGVMWVATVLVVPLFYPVPEEPRPRPARPARTVAEAPIIRVGR